MIVQCAECYYVDADCILIYSTSCCEQLRNAEPKGEKYLPKLINFIELIKNPLNGTRIKHLMYVFMIMQAR